VGINQKFLARTALSLIFSAATAGANATVLVATYTGTVTSSVDPGGLFGEGAASLVGDTYVATYTLDTTEGVHDASAPPYDAFRGGSVYGAISSPLSATLTINGVTLSIGGNYQGLADTDPTTPFTRRYAEDQTFSNGRFTDNFVTNVAYVVEPTITTPVPLTSFTTPGGGNSGTAQFSTVCFDGSCNLFTSLTLGAGTVQIGEPQVSGSVPEPATWAMMVAGFGGLGAALRRRRVAI